MKRKHEDKPLDEQIYQFLMTFKSNEFASYEFLRQRLFRTNLEEIEYHVDILFSRGVVERYQYDELADHYCRIKD